MRRGALLLLAALAFAAPARADEAFQRWLAGVKPEAAAAGVSAATFAAATAGLTPDLSVPNLERGGRAPSNAGQAEFTLTPAAYLSDKAIAGLAARGRALARTHAAAIARIERATGVPGPVALAILGRESAFGTVRLPHDGVRVLATQAYAGRRKEQFRQEFVLALKMLQDGVPRASLRSSWAGAMGLTQMLPSQYYRYAADGDGDGVADIFSSVPDALASIAGHLAGEGWRPGERWAYEVRAARPLDCTLGDPGDRRPLAEWRRIGVVPVDGADGRESASLLQPAGPYGPAFLITPNYFALKAYNFSDLYVLFVGHLADRIAGGGPFATPWGKVEQASAATIAGIQERLTGAGLYTGAVDGKAGMQTRLAIGRYQKARGLPLDCWPTPQVLRHMAAAP